MKVQRKRVTIIQRRMTVIGVFDDCVLADRAVTELFRAGFEDDQVVVALWHDQESGDVTAIVQDAIGAPGSLIDSESVAIAGVSELPTGAPPIDPPAAAGMLGCFPSDAAPAAGIVALLGDLVGAGVSEHEANYYRDEFEAGRSLVTVAAGSRSGEARAILRRYGSYEMISGIFSPPNVPRLSTVHPSWREIE